MPKGIYKRGRNSSTRANSRPIILVFWERVDMNGPIHPVHGQCWVWTAGRYKDKDGNSTGYGQFRNMGAHRVAYELEVGPIPNGMYVLHKCDNKACVNPSHLFIGTAQDNMTDKTKKGRWKGGCPKGAIKGSNNGRAILTEELARQIKTRYKVNPVNGRSNASVLAKEYGISRTAVNSIGKGITWKHV